MGFSNGKPAYDRMTLRCDVSKVRVCFMALSPILQTKIEGQINNNPIMIYMKGTPQAPQCGFSATTVQVFQALGVPFATDNILEDPDLRQGLKEFSSWPTFPQVYIDGEFIGGCDIVMEMYQRGELQPLVEQALQKVAQA